MHRLLKYAPYVIAFAFAFAVLSGDILNLIEPCGFKWGGG